MLLTRRLAIVLAVLALVAVAAGCGAPVQTEGGWLEPAMIATA